jgi:hypothetical protein
LTEVGRWRWWWFEVDGEGVHVIVVLGESLWLGPGEIVTREYPTRRALEEPRRWLKKRWAPWIQMADLADHRRETGVWWGQRSDGVFFQVPIEVEVHANAVVRSMARKRAEARFDSYLECACQVGAPCERHQGEQKELL